MISIDTETTGLNFWRHKIFGISQCASRDDFWFKRNEELDIEQLKALFKTDTPIVFHNAKFDLHMLLNEGFQIPSNFHDTQIMSELLNENVSHKLKDICKQYLNVNDWKDGVQEYVKKNNDCSYDKVPNELMRVYAANDGLHTWLITPVLLEKIKEEQLEELYQRELKVTRALIDVERYGFKIDTDYLKVLQPILEKEIQETEAQIFHEVGKTFNIDSDELGEVLFGMLKLPILAYTEKEHKPKIDDFILEKLNHPVIPFILRYRTASKMKSTYCNNIQELMDENGVIHCDFRQNGARTGRQSCCKPNLQNIPVTHAVRSLFICRPGFKIYCWDYKQQEIRLYAHFANDTKLKAWFEAGIDPYINMAKVFYNKQTISTIERSFIKTLTLAILYGIGAKGIAQKYNKTFLEAQAIKAKFNNAFPLMKKFSCCITDRIKQIGYIRNPYGRKRRLEPSIAYKGMNALIQGTAGDIMKEDLIRVNDLLKGTKSHIINSIHDDIMVEVHNDETNLIPEITKILEDFPQFSIKMLVDVSMFDTNWKEKKELLI
jgi:DNA polymerase-1